MGSDNPKIAKWDEVDYAEGRVEHDQKVFAYDIFTIMWELDTARRKIIDMNEEVKDLNAFRPLYKWTQAMSLKSSLIQALSCCRGEAYSLWITMKELTSFTVEHKAQHIRDPTHSHPDGATGSVIHHRGGPHSAKHCGN